MAPPPVSYPLDQPSPNPDRIDSPPEWLSTAIYRLNNLRLKSDGRSAAKRTQRLLCSIEAEEINAPVITVPPADGSTIQLDWKSGGKWLSMLVRSTGTVTIKQQPKQGLPVATCSYKVSPNLTNIVRESIAWIYPGAFQVDRATMERLTVAGR